MRQDQRDALILKWADYANPAFFSHSGYMSLISQVLDDYDTKQRRARRTLFVKLALTAVVLTAAGAILTILWWTP